MDFEEKFNGDILITKLLNTRLDAHTAENFKARFQNYIENNHQWIVMDISEVNFIDSSGLGAIVSVLKRMKGRGDIIISGTNDAVMRMFKLTRMNKIFKMVENEDLAVEMLQKEKAIES